MSFQCPQSNSSSKVTKFSESRARLVISIIYALPMICSILLGVYNLFFSSQEILRLLIEIIFGIGTLGYSLTGIIKYKQKIIELNGLTEILSNRQYYGFSSILSTRTVRSFLQKSYVAVFLTFHGEIDIITSMYLKENTPDMLMLYFSATVMVLYRFVHSISVFQGLFSSCLYKILFKKCSRKIENVLVNHLNIIKGNSIFKAKDRIKKSRNISFEEKVKRLKQLYTSLILNFNQLNKFSHPSFLLWWLELMGMFIINFYIIMKDYDQSNTDEIILHLRAYSSYLFVVYYIAMADQIPNAVRFPLSV